MDDRFERLDDLLDRALDLEGAERQAFIESECRDEDERERLSRLLSAAESGEDSLSGGGALAGDVGRALSDDLDGDDPTPDPIAGYELGRALGSGGMGNVWEAEQHEPVRRRVAVKIVRPELATGNIVVRFEAERQSLARMNHPGIAQIFDAGVTQGGRPYFAMELVDGLPLTKHCDENQLSVRARLRLFADVCEAVQHAHQKGVIHRDLKPSNILVATVDGKPQPKIIDFGISRVVGAGAAERTQLTQVGGIVGTPEYMSPEQAGSHPEDLDTRSDVYALGVLLFELLTGELPHARSNASPSALVSLFEEIREAPAPTASRRASDVDGAVAAKRGAERTLLVRSLRGDLDWIVARALEKDRGRRYASVGELKDEVRRYLRDEPVEAGPPGAVYRLKKFARRNRGLLVASAAVLFALVAGLVGTVSGLLRAQREAENAQTQAAIAEAVNDFLNEDLLAAVAPESQGREVTMQEVLGAAAERLDGKFEEQPEVEANLRMTIGKTYLSLGKLDDSSVALEQSLELFDRTRGPDDPMTLQAAHLLGTVRFYQGREDEALANIERVFEGRERTLGPRDPFTVSSLSDLGAVSQALGRLDAAEQYYRRAYDRAHGHFPEDDEVYLAILHNLGAILYDLGRHPEAIEMLTLAWERSRDAMGAEHPEALTTYSLLGTVLRKEGQLEEAETIYVAIYDARQRVLGEDHPSTLMSGNNVAVLYDNLGRYEEAIATHLEVLDSKRRVLGDDHNATVLTLSNLGVSLRRAGRPDEGAAYVEEGLEIASRIHGETHSSYAAVLRNLAECRWGQGRDEEAEAAFLRSYEIETNALGVDHPETRDLAKRLSNFYHEKGRAEEARTWEERAAPESSEDSGASD